MLKFLIFHVFFAIAFLIPQIVSAQKKDRVEIFPRILTEGATKNCKNLQTGQVIFYLIPDYPAEAKAARVGGTIEAIIKLDETGKFLEIEKVAGNRLLQGAATEAATKVKYSRTTCNGAPIPVSVAIVYNFIPYAAVESYFVASKIEDFPDVKSDSEFYEAILDLTENYKIAFGYADKNFYTEAPLTRGELAQFLRLTLDLISDRAKSANKNPRQFNLFYPYNPNNVISFDRIKNLDKKAPFFDSVKILLLKYNISLADEKNEFDGRVPVSQNQLVDLWTKIFGAEAVPVNFERKDDGDRIITRGEFALFLQESLGVLTYKALP